MRKDNYLKSMLDYLLWKARYMNGMNALGEWLLFNANSAIFQLYHGENKLIFNEMMMRSALY
jgi:hypothetical protein